MPEGHTLHRLANELTVSFAGQVVSSSSPQGRFTDASQFDGQVLSSAQAWGKHLLVEFAGLDVSVHVHLGLYGTFVVSAGVGRPVVGQVRWRLQGDSQTADLRGPTACEVLDPAQVELLVERLGPDPLRADADPGRWVDRVRSSRAPIATLLMDQRVIAGVGNVYRAETLFRQRLDPMRPGQQVRPRVLEAIWTDLAELMAVGVRTGRIDTVRDEHLPEVMGRPPRVDDHGGEVYVYRRAGEPCFVCGRRVQTKELAGRNLFWCPRCQRSR